VPRSCLRPRAGERHDRRVTWSDQGTWEKGPYSFLRVPADGDEDQRKQRFELAVNAGLIASADFALGNDWAWADRARGPKTVEKCDNCSVQLPQDKDGYSLGGLAATLLEPWLPRGQMFSIFLCRKCLGELYQKRTVHNEALEGQVTLLWDKWQGHTTRLWKDR